MRKANVWAEIPRLEDTDVFIAGAGTGVVAAALAARREGRRVLVASDLTYFGEECAGALRVWPERESDHPLFRALFPARREGPPTPLRLKSVLDEALLDAGVRFLFGVRPVALLRAATGALRGVVLAHRTALYAVVCTTAVDATRHGLLARLAGVPLEGRRSAPATLDWILLAADAPVPERPGDFTCIEAGAPFARVAGPKGDLNARAWRLSFPRPADAGDRLAARAALEHRLRARVVEPRMYYGADIIPDATVACLGEPCADDPRRLPESVFAVRPGLYVMNGLLPLSPAGAAALDETAVQVELGERLGGLAAAARPGRPLRAPRLDTGAESRWRTAVKGDFRFAPSFIREGDIGTGVPLDWATAPPIGEYDVAVAGGGTGGAPAGIAAARAGARTVVLESRYGLGGVGTLGFIASYWFGNRVGFTKEIDDALERDAPGSAKEWNPDHKSAWYQRALLDAGGEAWFGSFAFGVQMEEGRVAGLLVSTPFGSGLLRAGAVVDASGNSDIAAAAGAPVRTVDERHVAVQGAGLSPRHVGQRYSNSDHSFIDDSDPVGVTHAFANARRKFPDYFDVSALVNSRERRQIIGEYELSPLDFLAGRTFPDTIATAYSTFDSHGFTVHPAFLVLPPDHSALYAHVPFRCLLPRGVEGLLVTGLGLSAHRDALPVVRMQADVQNHGYAAGLAVAESALQKVPLRALDIRALQRRWVEAGILAPDVPSHNDSFPLPAEAIRAAALEGPTNFYRTAVIFAHPEASAPILAQVMAHDTDPARRENAALVLGLLHRPDAAGALAEIVRSRPWDEGWNYRGMGQFGYSMSRMDALLVALGRAAAAEGTTAERRAAAIAAVREKIETLGDSPAFSHCRAVAIAAGALNAQELAEPLARVLRRPGLSGHAQLDIAAVVRSANREMNETQARNNGLRELYLARGLFWCGDFEELGLRTLETFARDLRGPFARHARCVLSDPQPDRTRVEAL